ncbi:protein of unknown function [Cupriavidus taiwanensis]|nr:protein of unknown function [Cupriavidus taiwanensis]
MSPCSPPSELMPRLACRGAPFFVRAVGATVDQRPSFMLRQPATKYRLFAPVHFARPYLAGRSADPPAGLVQLGSAQ